jgi:hypothetical protein
MAVRLVLYEGVIQAFIAEHATKLVTETADEVAVAAKLLAPKDTGALAASIHATAPTVSGMRVSAEVGSDEAYALFVHEGTRAHEEHARPGHVLYLGAFGFAASVQHPATAGQPYLLDPLERIGRRVGFVVTKTAG